MIDLSAVVKRYVSRRGAVEVLGGVDLRVGEGEIVSLVGPSGCGKTTLLQLVAGLDRPDGGEVRVAGERVRGPGADRALLFQEAALFPWLSVAGNVEFGLAMAGVRRRERRERAQRWLEAVGLGDAGEASVHELSGGMRQRAALARALAPGARILLLDEPFSSLDAHAREAAGDLVEALWLRERLTVLFVTHDLDEAVRLGSRVVALGGAPARVLASVDVPLARPRASTEAAASRDGGELRGTLRERIARVAAPRVVPEPPAPREREADDDAGTAGVDGARRLRAADPVDARL